ncbi:hypothetical protein RHSIM_Rhsim11G0029200 [Rhododendron simsii]|uniref:Uncharacterized protein n=1 Tax=Rhododendron simsii TaxID=118357 RepID=A0A834G688_RHOSS|nr:hypothetical protein RHSIM_Rhsim11G0029200 [Rhododendron simsii]
MACWGTVGLESQVEEMKSAQCGRIFGRRRLRVKLNTLSGNGNSVKEVLFKRKVGEKMKSGDHWRARSFGGYGNVEMMFTSQAQVVAERGPDPPSAVQRWISALLSSISGSVSGRCTSGVNSDLVAWLHFGGYDSVLFTPFDVVSTQSGLPLVPSFHFQPSQWVQVLQV